jgi:hypothetical protein
VAHRPLKTILAEWRILDRNRDANLTPAERLELDQGVTALADEYREAQDAQRSEPSSEQQPTLSTAD